MIANGRIDKEAVKAAAAGRWAEIVPTVTETPADLFDGRNHPCPKCGGTDRFFVHGDFAETGGAGCRHCFNERGADGLATVGWLRGCTFPEAVSIVAQAVGLADRNGHHHANGHADIIEAVARAKKMPVDAFRTFGAIEAKRGKLTVARVPVYDHLGKPHSHFDLTPDGKGWFAKGKGAAGVFLPSRAPQPGETWLLVEGVKDAAALVGLGFNAAGLPRNEMPAKFGALFRGVHVVVVPDLDKAGMTGADKTAARLAGVATSVQIARLPGEVVETGGADVRDVLAKHGADVVRQAIQSAVAWEPTAGKADDNRVRIYAGPKEHEVADQAIEALSRLDGVYQRGGNLVSIVCDPEPPAGIIRPEGSLYLCPIEEAGMCDRLSQAAQFYNIKSQGDDLIEVDIAPPLRIAKIVLSRRGWPGVPVIEGVIRAPVFLADGSVLVNRGYCRKTGLYLASEGDFPSIPERPTKADAEAARDELLEVVCDFPFASDAHKAAWLALMLTPAARFAFDGPVPLGAFDANVRGSGKSKLADSISMVHLGTDMPRTPAPHSDDEFRKQITSVLLAGERMMLIDNVAGMLGCASIDALLTATSWNERILGQTRMTGRMAATTVWLASGNNLVFSADTARRALVCRLVSMEENPEEREGFRHPNLLQWVRENRPRLAAAVIVILRAYHVAGRPDMGLPQWGSYESWSNLIRNAVVWCGMEDPGATRQEVREGSDREAALLRQLIAAWEDADPQRHGMTVPQAIEKANAGNELLQAAFAEFGTPGKPHNTRSIGMKLHHMKGRVVGGKFFERRTGRDHVALWLIVGGDGQGTNGTRGTKTHLTYTRAPARTHAHTHARTGEAVSSPLSSPSPTSGCSHEWQVETLSGGPAHVCKKCDAFGGYLAQHPEPWQG